MISKDIYERLLQLRHAPRTKDVINEIHHLKNELTHIIPNVQPMRFIHIAIGMYEGNIPYDTHYRKCKACGVTYRRMRSTGKTREYICKCCTDKNIGWCDIHNIQIEGTSCYMCDAKESHKKYPDTDKKSYVECTVCGYRTPHLAAHYKVTHKMLPDQYSRFDLVCEKTRDAMRGENNPAFGHGGRLSPFSKNFKKYKSEEDYIKGFNSAYAKQAKTIAENPQNWDTKIEFYLAQGMTQEDAEKALSERQATFNLRKCIERHGEEEGKKIWQERQDKWQSTLNSKSQEEIDLINRKKSVLSLDSYIARGFTEEEALPMLEAARTKMKVGYSKEALIFMKSFIPEEIMDKAYHSDKEWFIYHKEQRRYFLYDFMFNNVIFEYHGEAYHPNPDIISEEKLVNWKTPYGLTAEYVLNNDRTKKTLAEQNGFKFFYVYSNDSDERKEQVKKNILNAIYEK